MAAAQSSYDRIRSFLVLAATLGVIGFNALASMGYVNGVTPGEISDNYPTSITPAGYAFSIWSLIYLGRLYDAQDERDQAVQYYRAALEIQTIPPAARQAAEKGLQDSFRRPK